MKTKKSLFQATITEIYTKRRHNKEQKFQPSSFAVKVHETKQTNTTSDKINSMRLMGIE